MSDSIRRYQAFAELQTMCYLCRYLWIRKAFTVTVCSKLSEPSFSQNYINLKVLNFKQQLRPTSQKKDQLTRGRSALCFPTFTATSRLQTESFLHKTY